jgi:hypothetical protein
MFVDRYLLDSKKHNIKIGNKKISLTGQGHCMNIAPIVRCKPIQVNQYGYPYFHRRFASYGAVNGPYFLVIMGTVIRHRIQGRIFRVYDSIRAVISL